MSKTWTDEELVEAARSSSTQMEMMKKIGLTPRGRTYGSLRPHIIRLGIDLSHMNRSGPIKDILVQNGTASRATVRKKILGEGLIPYVCAKCGNGGEWMGLPLKLQLDHENGVCFDHRKENLRFLCPNCHSQTETYAKGTGQRPRRDSSARILDLVCCECGRPFQRTQRKAFLKDGYRTFCTHQCSALNRAKSAPILPRHVEVYEDWLRTQSYLGTSKKFGISDVMVKKIVKRISKTETKHL